MKQEPSISVIMNCYNSEKYLKESIDSVYAQSYKAWEIVLWDNASIDGTEKIATSYDSRIKYFRAQVNTHLGPARNKALEQAKAKYIAFLDSDDVYLPCALQRQVELMESDDYGLVYGGVIYINEKGDIKGRNRLRYRSGYNFDNLLRRYDISMCSVMIRKSLIDKEGLKFNENMSYCPDFNLFMKIAAKHKLGVIQEPIVKYRRSPASLSRKTLNLVSKEQGQTLNELNRLYPHEVMSSEDEMAVAYARLNFYDAVYHISIGNYWSARSALKPVIGRSWKYLVIYLVLFLPMPKSWLLRMLNR
jgi:glycosyltransferase involved in cell wall biosynthesis